MTERECPECGYRGYAKANAPCLTCGTPMAQVIRPKRIPLTAGVLCRDRVQKNGLNPVIFFPECPLNVVFMDAGLWIGGEKENLSWSIEEWKTWYGTLPRKGSKQMVLIELNE